MTDTPMLSAQMIADELSAGIATIKFILRRFDHHIPCSESQGQTFYPADALGTISQIMEKLNMGDLPSQIENALHTQPASSSTDSGLHQNEQDIRISEDGLGLLKSLFNDIGEQQKRIAIAHEKRAEAEERKAVAIEKRAEAEEKKAQAMNNIAAALQEMNQLRASLGPVAEQITHQAVAAVASDNISEDIGPFDTDEVEPSVQPESKNFEDETEASPIELIKSKSAQAIDDLSSLIDNEDVPSDAPDTEKTVELDNLWSLIQDSDALPSEPEPEDNLSDEGQKNQDAQPQVDDLYALIDDNVDSQSDSQPEVDKEAFNKDMDDLSLLVDDGNDTKEGPTDLDDLSLLIDENTEAENASVTQNTDTADIEENLDDLSLLIEPEDSAPSSESRDNKDRNDVELDDLSKLIDSDPKESKAQSSDNEEESKPDQPLAKIEIDVSPDQVAKYKAAIMKTILGLRADGMTPEQTTQIFNDNHIKTLSGKPEWSLKAVTQIYKFIESAS